MVFLNVRQISFTMLRLALPVIAGLTTWGYCAKGQMIEPEWELRESSATGQRADKAAKFKAAGRYGKAASLYKNLANRADSVRGEARWLAQRGHCLYKMEKWQKALEAYREVIRSRAGSADVVKIAKHLRVISLKLASGGVMFTDRRAAIQAGNLVRSIMPAPRVGLRVARWYGEEGKLQKAVETYQGIIEKHSGTVAAAEARMELGRLYAKMSEEKGGAGKYAGFTHFYLERAQHAADKLLERADSLREEADEANEADRLASKARAIKEQVAEIQARLDKVLAERLYKKGRFYTWAAHRRPEQAVRFLRETIQKYPDTPAVEKARALLADLDAGDAPAGEKAEKGGSDKQKEKKVLEPPDISEVQRQARDAEGVHKYLRPIEDLSSDIK